MRRHVGALKLPARFGTLILFGALLLNQAPSRASVQERVDSAKEAERLQALAALDEVLSEAKGYDDRNLRAKIKAEIADLLWPSEPARGRDLIVEAFDDATALQTPLSERYAVRANVIAIARQHDPQLAAKLIAQVSDQSEESRELLSRDSLERISERGGLYVDSAREFLRDGDQGRAVEFVRKGMFEGRSAQFIWFLTELRQRDKAAADKLFLEAVNMLRGGTADPNDVLHLGLYLFYPGRVAVGTLGDGVEAVSYGISFAAAPPVPSALARPYLQAAAAALLSYQVMSGRGTAGSVELKRFALLQLLPLFQRYEPQLAAEVAGALAGLGPQVPSKSNAAETENYTDEKISESDLISKIERLNDRRERDHYFFTALKVAIERGSYERARTLAARIGGDELKEASLEWIGFNEAQTAIKRGELERASRIASAELTDERRAVIYFQLASSWLGRGDFSRAGIEVNAAVAEAEKIDSPAQRAQVYILLAAGMAERDAQRAFEFIESAAKDINAAEQFDPANDRLTFTIKTPFASYNFSLSQGAGLLSTVTTLARIDLNRALAAARMIKPAAPRALSIISACRAALTKASHKPGDKVEKLSAPKPGKIKLRVSSVYGRNDASAFAPGEKIRGTASPNTLFSDARWARSRLFGAGKVI
jgi:hypothetical protein